jgi:hypothetical protein
MRDKRKRGDAEAGGRGAGGRGRRSNRSSSPRPARGVELLPRSLAHLKREISEKKWSEARQWAGSRINKAKYKMPARQKPDEVVASSFKRHASRFYQLKTGHCLTGQHLHRMKSHPTPQC